MAETSAHQPPAARTLGACVVRALMAFEAPTGSAPVAPLFVKLPQRGRESPGQPRSAASAERGETRKRRELGGRDLSASSPGQAGQHLDPSVALGHWESRVRATKSSRLERGCAGTAGRTCQTSQKFSFSFFKFSSLFSVRSECTGWGKRGGLGSGSFRLLFSFLTARQSSGPWPSLGPARLAGERILPPPCPPWAQGARKFDLMPGYVMCAERAAGVGLAGGGSP